VNACCLGPHHRPSTVRAQLRLVLDDVVVVLGGLLRWDIIEVGDIGLIPSICYIWMSRRPTEMCPAPILLVATMVIAPTDHGITAINLLYCSMAAGAPSACPSLFLLIPEKVLEVVGGKSGISIVLLLATTEVRHGITETRIFSRHFLQVPLQTPLLPIHPQPLESHDFITFAAIMVRTKAASAVVKPTGLTCTPLSGTSHQRLNPVAAARRRAFH